MILGILSCTVPVKNCTIKDTAVHEIIFVMKLPANPSESSRGGRRGQEG